MFWVSIVKLCFNCLFKRFELKIFGNLGAGSWYKVGGCEMLERYAFWVNVDWEVIAVIQRFALDAVSLVDFIGRL